MKRFLSFFVFVVSAMSMVHADFVCKGCVVDATDNEPLLAAVVIVKDSDIKTTTNLNGEFSLTVPDGAVLRIAYVGYDVLTVKAKPVMGKLMLDPYKLTPPTEEQVAEWMRMAKEYNAKKEYSEALPFYEMAQRAGNLVAQYMVGNYYFLGYGTDVDKKYATELFMSAAEAGQPDAEWVVGLFYLEGTEYITKDVTEAKRWLKKAADQGNKEAKALLYDIMQGKY